jgi:hypothetical protein
MKALAANSSPRIPHPAPRIADPDAHLAASYVDRFDVGCEGELIDSFPDAAAALRFARWSAAWCESPHQIFDAPTHTCLAIIDPPEAA